MAAPEIHTITRIGANGNYSTGGTDIGPHRGGGGSGGSCSWNEITGKPNFARVATTGSYNDLSNKPTIPPAYDDTALAARVTALEQSGGGTPYDDTAIKARITAAENRLNGLATVATSGSYNDLSNKPTIPAAYDDTALKNRVTALENKTDQDTKPVLMSDLTTTQAIGNIPVGTTYAAGTSLETILRALLAPAVTPQPTYTITFNANGGTVTPTSGTTGTDGKLASLPTPTHATDTFKGWFTAATGGTAVTTNTVFTSNDTIFAQWEAATQDYPWFATTVNTTSAEQFDVDRSLGEYIVNVAAQTEQYPIYIDIPADWNAQAQKWNPFTNQWVRSNDLDSFSTTHNIDGTDVAYTRWMDITETDAAATRIRIIWNV